MTEDTDIWFGLRGAGSSFAIVTEFMVNVFPRPETLPILIPILLQTPQDLANIEVTRLRISKCTTGPYSPLIFLFDTTESHLDLNSNNFSFEFFRLLPLLTINIC